MDDKSFEELSQIVYRDSGIVLSTCKRNLLVSRLSNRLRDLNLKNYSEYCDYLRGELGPSEIRKLTPLVTTNVTRFFREAHHFDYLRTDLLPPLIERARKGGSVRVWSAGCSTGEEPYSIAMVILDMFPEAAEHNVKILGTDIDPIVIQTGRSGHYQAVSTSGPHNRLLTKFMRNTPDDHGSASVADDLRKLVTLNELNLLHDWPMQRPFDIIFCRNVVIYFDAGTQNKLWKRFADQLKTGGHLILGHSERVNCDDFPELKHVGVTSYQKLSSRPMEKDVAE